MQDLSVDELMDKWVLDWTYHTDTLLVHCSGFAVQFDDDAPKGSAHGGIVPGSAAGYAQLIEQWAREPNHAELLRWRPLRQATLIYRRRPAGTMGAPRRLVGSDRDPPDTSE